MPTSTHVVRTHADTCTCTIQYSSILTCNLRHCKVWWVLWLLFHANSLNDVLQHGKWDV